MKKYIIKKDLKHARTHFRNIDRHPDIR